jgi:alpha-tubulin suppressor-like RCC1 family protein
LALRENGHIAAWGGNSLGQLGIGNNNAQSGVVQVRGTTPNQSDLRLLPAPSRNLTWLWILLAALVATAVAVFVFVL